MAPENPPPNTSGQGRDAQVPPEIPRWNWGAAVFGSLWTFANGLTMDPVTMTPTRRDMGWFFFSFKILGAKGNEIAWKYRRWPSVEVFLRVQRRWEAAALALLTVVGVWLMILAFTALAKR